MKAKSDSTGARFLCLAVVAVAVLALAGITSVPRAHADEGTVEVPPSKEYEIATFAGGCFWCMEPAFDKLDGVINTISGYTGGLEKNPTYKEVSSGKTGHTESLRIEYDARKISYEQLLEVYWHNIDPTTPDRQFCDYGTQYRPEIFYHNEAQKRLAEESLKELKASGKFAHVAVAITAATAFYAAEDYHQDFYKKNPEHYYRYRKGCRRDARLEELWGKQ